MTTVRTEAPARVLVVDDVELNRDLLERRVTRLGHEVLTVADGLQALEALRREAFDVVLLDLMMPGLSGDQVLAQMKADSALRHVPVIMISANEDLKTVAHCISLGADDYLPKPFDPGLLKARLAASLAKKRLHDREQVHAQSLERELEIGRNIQQSFLPSRLPDLPGFGLAARLRPARQVSGDFYDAFAFGEGREAAVVVGDVCDKGVGASLFMALLRTLLRALAEQSDGARWSDPTRQGADRREGADRRRARRDHLQRTVTLASEYIADTHGDTNVFATLFFGIIDGETGEMDYINAGQEPPLIAGAGRLERLEPTGPAVGLLPGLEFTVGRVTLQPGEHLAIWTDGVSEARSEADALLGEEPLLAALGGPMASAEAVLDRIFALVDGHAGAADQSDDITVLTVHRQPAGDQPA